MSCAAPRVSTQLDRRGARVSTLLDRRGPTISTLLDRRGRFTNLWGESLPAVPRLPRGQPDVLLARQNELGIDEDTSQCGDGHPVALGDAVDALLAISS